MKILDKILKHFGYYRFSMPKGASVTEAEILELFGTYGDNEVYVRFLRDLCAQDKRLHFQASNDRDRFTIRGAHDRNLYFISLIKKAHDRRKRGK